VLRAVNPDTDVDPSDAALHASWSAGPGAPTVPTIVFRRVVFPNVTGSGITWIWDRGSGIELSRSAGSAQWLVLWNFGAAAMAAQNVNVRARA
jgi:hypothetical protein